MSFYSYIFKPSDFIKGYCFNISWMDECTHWWNTGKNEAHTAWNDHSQSACHFQTCSQILCFICNRKQLGDSEVFGTMFSIHLWVKRQRAACPPSSDKRMAVETSSLGEKMRCYSQWRHGAEKVGDETKMCLFMPTGVLTLLQAAIAFCQERELKGLSQTSTLSKLTLLLLLLGQLWYPKGAEKRSLPTEVLLKSKAGSVSLRWIWRCQSAHSQLVFQSRGEGQIEFRVRAMTDGCRGTLLSTATPQSPGFTGCERDHPARTGPRTARADQTALYFLLIHQPGKHQLVWICRRFWVSITSLMWCTSICTL